jgi:hypothetical protein
MLACRTYLSCRNLHNSHIWMQFPSFTEWLYIIIEAIFFVSVPNVPVQVFALGKPIITENENTSSEATNSVCQ